ncbi:65-kDa microtubule-associated protein 3 [Zea mays]|uniref:65-kDa microtubule-associated protein 3 n=1 Tax=Zea mays TaxID=4577 RepID=A0A1D6QTV9_MAIZE|nr:65-kDa microtubule-associated protein 3 [Zea mays]AQK60847.1 65-kDa microtubule-associated protein 3 [Zea mays]
MQCTHATSSIGREPVSRCCLHLTWCCSGTIHHSVQICRRHYWRVGRRTEEGEKLKPAWGEEVAAELNALPEGSS